MRKGTFSCFIAFLTFVSCVAAGDGSIDYSQCQAAVLSGSFGLPPQSTPIPATGVCLQNAANSRFPKPATAIKRPTPHWILTFLYQPKSLKRVVYMLANTVGFEGTLSLQCGTLQGIT